MRCNRLSARRRSAVREARPIRAVDPADLLVRHSGHRSRLVRRLRYERLGTDERHDSRAERRSEADGTGDEPSDDGDGCRSRTATGHRRPAGSACRHVGCRDRRHGGGAFSSHRHRGSDWLIVR